ncbi:NAD kinase [Loigolactobacillus backii]|uniref:NAD kinase n=1 Tax=Loigolactobacillus backii TaxID=375175 RepID=A0A192H5C6_9LACO|nr:NAD kinase [Loigolactobacillus backii]ANK60069.1 NAD kinase [Loigolactobacillus backii]ANK63417.1 NAD kinase [Loigolactobacillus backii]ANK64952.1 NAD kinase [Loigolactobacillus backii]ANK66547.1 NAD kinase [Loigolactobacillus backii]ANK69578.1 NAD kinase [Loigolactobacillus backii]
MRVSVFYNSGKKSQQVATKLIKKLVDCAFEIDDKNPDIVISIGGDGTLLSAFHKFSTQLNQVRFVGVHTGHLGFYTDWRDYEIDDLVESLKHDTGQQISYPLLDVGVQYVGERDQKHYLALNESTLKRVSATMVTDVYIRDELFESFRGDGLCVSTPTGSTAYNKSIGGAVLHPRLEAIQLTEIASLNNRVFRTLGSPVVIAPDEWIDIKPDQTAQDYIMTIDQFMPRQKPIERIRYRIADQRIAFARYRHMHFWNRVEDAFIGEKQGS